MLLSFMDEAEVDEATTPRLDEAVAAFLDRLTPGDGSVGCLFLWYAFEHDHEGVVSEGDFEAACRRLGRTKTIYGRGYVTGVDEKATRQWFVAKFADTET